MKQPAAARRLGWVLVCCTAALLAGNVVAQGDDAQVQDAAVERAGDEQPVVQTPAVPDHTASRAALLDEDASRVSKQNAAESIVRNAADGVEQAEAVLLELLAPEQPVETRRFLLRALSVSPAMPSGQVADAVAGMADGLPAELESSWSKALGRFELERIADALAEVAGNPKASSEQRRAAIRALGEHRRPFAVAHLFELLGEERPEQVRGWAFDALANLSHQPGIGRDRDAWAGWYSNARRLSASQWQRMLHDNLLRLNREREDIDRLTRERLIQSQRALYRATDPEQRPALLAQLLQDRLDPVRGLAMDLARQRLDDNGVFGPALRNQLRQRLDDPLAGIRADAATLLGQLLDAPGADAIAQRLADGSEQEAVVRRAYFNALTPNPRAEALAPAYELLNNPALRDAAAGMLAAAHRNELGDEALWKDVRKRVKQALDGVESPRPQMVTLLGLVLEDDDQEGWSRIGGWLSAEDDRLRGAAARVWADSSRSLAVLAERCDDPVVRPIALRAIAERARSRQTLAAVAGHRPEEADDIRLWEQAMVALAERVAPEALLETIDGLADQNGETRQVREQMLTAAIDRENKPDPPARADVRLLIARGAVRVLDDAPALVVLDYEAALKHAEKLTKPQAEQARRGLATAYLADGRIDDALKTVAEVLKPGGELSVRADADGLVDLLTAAAARAAEQNRKADATKLIAGIRALLGESISEKRGGELDSVQAELDKTPEPSPAS